MNLKNRLEKLESTPRAAHHVWAREELMKRIQCTDPETRKRVLGAIRDKARADAVQL